MMVYTTNENLNQKLTKTELSVLKFNDYKAVRINENGTKALWVRTEFGEVVSTKWKNIPLKDQI